MVTIVNRGPHASVVRSTICRHCGSTLEYVPFDIKQKIVSDYTGCKDTLHYIECANCRHIIYVKQYG